MSEPATQMSPAERNLRYARPLSVMAAPLSRCISQLDSAIVARISAADAVDELKILRLEILILWRARMGLVAHHRPTSSLERVDPVVAEALLEAVDFSASLATELDAKGLGRLLRLWQGCREIAGELMALGTDVHTHRAELVALRQSLLAQKTSLADAERQIAKLGATLTTQFFAVGMPRNKSLVEQLLTSPV